MTRFTGDPLPKRVIQAMLKTLGYKVVQIKAYERRETQTARPDGATAKIFGIGFNKTATTTLGQLLRDLGYRMPKQLEQEAFLADVVDAGDWGKLRAFCEEYDAFQDLPFSQNTTYVACDALFPGARFVLTERDAEKWADSYIKFYKRSFDVEDVDTFTEATFAGKSQYLQTGYVHGVLRRLLQETVGGETRVRWDLAFDRDFLIDRYQRRNAEVKAYFGQRPNDLFILDPSQEKDTGRLLEFLGVDPSKAGPYPRANVG